MTLTCRGFRATPLATGEIRLEIEEAKTDALEDRMSLKQIAEALTRSVKSVQKLSVRKKNPLPLRRGNGRPYGFRSELNRWLETENSSAYMPLAFTRQVFG